MGVAHGGRGEDWAGPQASWVFGGPRGFNNLFVVPTGILGIFGIKYNVILKSTSPEVKI